MSLPRHFFGSGSGSFLGAAVIRDALLGLADTHREPLGLALRQVPEEDQAMAVFLFCAVVTRSLEPHTGRLSVKALKALVRSYSEAHGYGPHLAPLLCYLDAIEAVRNPSKEDS